MPVGLIRWLLPYLLVAAVAASMSWWVRAQIADDDLAALEKEYTDAHAAQMVLKAASELVDRLNTKQSTERIDEVEQTREVEVRYVNREVIKYVEAKPESCPLPARWVCLTNAALGLPCE